MSVGTETEKPHIDIQPRAGEAIDVYRIDGAIMLRCENFPNPNDAEITLQERTALVSASVSEAKLYLGFNTGIAAIIFLQALRRRSRVLAAVGLAAGTGALYANGRRKAYAKESGWLEKEMIALEEYRDEQSISALQE